MRSFPPAPARIGPTWLVALLLGACAPAFPRQLLTIEASRADYPVMLSDMRLRNSGRTIEAASGTLESQAGNTHTSAHSELGASAKLAAQVQRADKWVQIEHVEFFAADLYAVFGASEERTLYVKANAQP
jgi:hypothetical protein